MTKVQSQRRLLRDEDPYRGKQPNDRYQYLHSDDKPDVPEGETFQHTPINHDPFIHLRGSRVMVIAGPLKGSRGTLLDATYDSTKAIGESNVKVELEIRQQRVGLLFKQLGIMYVFLLTSFIILRLKRQQFTESSHCSTQWILLVSFKARIRSPPCDHTRAASWRPDTYSD
jgi:hypothetical protein